MSSLLFATDWCKYALQNPFSCFCFVFTSKMSKWQVVVTRRQSRAAAASSITFPSLASFRHPFSDQMNQSNDNQQISKASGGAKGFVGTARKTYADVASTPAKKSPFSSVGSKKAAVPRSKTTLPAFADSNTQPVKKSPPSSAAGCKKAAAPMKKFAPVVSKKAPVPAKKSPSSSAGSKKATFHGKKSPSTAVSAKKDAAPVRKSPSSTIRSKKAYAHMKNSPSCAVAAKKDAVTVNKSPPASAGSKKSAAAMMKKFSAGFKRPPVPLKKSPSAHVVSQVYDYFCAIDQRRVKESTQQFTPGELLECGIKPPR
jgi:hypothetical protein